ncbi:unnamed protein product, partial [marine sediment metagenome]
REGIVMANISATEEMYIPLTGLDGGRLMMHIGNATMLDAAGISDELLTKLTNIICAIITPKAYNAVAASGIEVFFCDRAITTGRVTVQRKVDDPGFDEFQFILIGKVY